MYRKLFVYQQIKLLFYECYGNKQGNDVERNKLTEFNSNNIELLNVEQVKKKLLSIQYVRDEIADWEKGSNENIILK